MQCLDHPGFLVPTLAMMAALSLHWLQSPSYIRSWWWWWNQLESGTTEHKHLYMLVLPLLLGHHTGSRWQGKANRQVVSNLSLVSMLMTSTSSSFSPTDNPTTLSKACQIILITNQPLVSYNGEGTASFYPTPQIHYAMANWSLSHSSVGSNSLV